MNGILGSEHEAFEHTSLRGSVFLPGAINVRGRRRTTTVAVDDH